MCAAPPPSPSASIPQLWVDLLPISKFLPSSTHHLPSCEANSILRVTAEGKFAAMISSVSIKCTDGVCCGVFTPLYIPEL